MVLRKRKKTFSLLMSLIFILLFPICVFATTDDTVEYTTEGGEWVQVDENTFTMDKDDDGEADIVLIKGETQWRYLFKVADPTAEYYAWEENVPEGYEIVDGIGSRANPIVVNAKHTKVSHTPNISDLGVKNGNYSNNANINHVVTIPGATSLHVTIQASGESTSYDWACVWAGNHSEYTAQSNYSSSVSGKLGGSPRVTKEYDIDGDTVTFGFRSDGSGVGDGFGYYAVIKANNEIADPVITNRSTTEEPVEKGSLQILKTVTGDVNIGKNFRFDIELSSEDEKLAKLIEGKHTYGDITFNNGKGMIYLSHDSSVSLNGIPEGVKYSISESDNEGYKVTWSKDGESTSSKKVSGVISGNSLESVVCENYKEPPSEDDTQYGNLTVSKEIVNGDESDLFDFTAVLWGLRPEYEYKYVVGSDERLFTANSAGMTTIAFDMSGGNTAVIYNLPVGCQYQIVEGANEYTSSYQIIGGVQTVMTKGENFEPGKEIATSKETLDEGEDATIAFKNSKPDVSQDMVNIDVHKVWVDNDNKNKIRPEYVTAYLLQDDDVIQSVRLDDSNEWKYTFDGLEKFKDDGITEYVYSVKEISVPGYITDVVKNENVYTITNTSQEVGSIRVSKSVTGNKADKSKSFKFTLELEKDGKPLSGTYDVDDTMGTKSGTIVFDKGKASFNLKDGESIAIVKLPVGVEYRVTEEAVSGYTEKNDGEYTGTISKGEMSDVSFVNDFSSYSISVSKEVTGSMGDKSKNFKFSLELKGDSAPTEVNYVLGSEEGTIEVVDGFVEFTLSHDETIVFTDIPSGVEYLVQEEMLTLGGYKTTYSNESGTVSSDNIAVRVTNSKDVSVPTSADTNTRVIACIVLAVVIGICVYLYVRYRGERKHSGGSSHEEIKDGKSDVTDDIITDEAPFDGEKE